MSLKSKIEAVIYASEEPVTLPQLVGLLGEEAQAELDAAASLQAELPIDGADDADAAGYTFGVEEESEAQSEHEAAADGRSTVNSAETIPSSVPPSEALPEAAVGQEEVSSPETAPDVQPGDATGNAEAVPEALSAESERRLQRERERAVRDHIRRAVDQLIREYTDNDRGVEIREVANGFRMGTKPEYHDAVRGFVKSLKPALKLTLPALETLAVVAYKQPVTAAEISEIRGVDSAGVLGGLMSRKLIATAGRKQVIGRPMLYKTTKDFLLRFGLKDISELPSMEEFERMAGELAEQDELPIENADAVIEQANARGDAEHIREAVGQPAEQDAPEDASSPESQTGDAAESARPGEPAPEPTPLS